MNVNLSKKLIQLFLNQLFRISLFLCTINVNSQNSTGSLIDLQKVESKNNSFIECIEDYIRNKDENCSQKTFYYYISFENENQFFISRIFEDYNNFIERCNAYVEINGQNVLIKKSNFWQNHFYETARYKKFFYYKSNNEHFFPFGYQSDSKYYKIVDGIITLERTKPCESE